MKPGGYSNLLLLFACILGTAAAMAQERNSSGLKEIPCIQFPNPQPRCFLSGGVKLVMPNISLWIPDDTAVRSDPLSTDYYFIVRLKLKKLIEENKTSLWQPMKFRDFRVELRKEIQSTTDRNNACDSLVSVSGRWQSGQYPKVKFRCRSRAMCLSLLKELRFNGADQEELLSVLKFTFYGKTFEITRIVKPVESVISLPFKSAFWFEIDKLLLYTLEANSGFKVYETYQTEQSYSIPEDGFLPRIYRSSLLDQLGQVAATGRWQIVVEMRTANKMVAQAVFSAEPAGLDMYSWFSPTRLLSTSPFWFGRSNYNVFSIYGDERSNDSLIRRFTINRHYGGCGRDTGLFLVSDTRDTCEPLNRGWRGQPPVLIYSTKANIFYNTSSAFAERFLIYLRPDRPVPMPYALKPSILPGAFEFEDGKVLLFMVKANSNHEAVTTYLNRQAGLSTVLTGGTLPDAFRSDIIDNLGQAVIATGKQFIVAEMRVGDRMVSQVVFDASVDRLSLDKLNWFSGRRIVSSYPYPVLRSLNQSDEYFHSPDVRDPRYDLISIPGDTREKRGFFIKYSTGGCVNDRAFWVVSDISDVCLWSSSGWQGRPPALIYTESQDASLQSGGAKYADRFLIYLK